jgi:predicted glutamine amidotransferase
MGGLFCHNGTVFNHEKLITKKYPPEGGTDSEAIFLFLLERIGKKKGSAALPALRNGLEEMRKLTRFSSFNFLLCDGRVLYAYREYDPTCREGGYRSEMELESYYTLFHAIEPGEQLFALSRLMHLANGFLSKTEK